jgi:broad specificity phosphatase PhoE
VEIVCLRHGESENVLAGASGAVPEASLTEHGRTQARAAGGAVWGAPLPHAVPFTVRRDGSRWQCPCWPA